MNEQGQYDFNSIATRELRAKNPLGVSLSGTFSWENVDYTYPGRANENDPNDTPQAGVDNLLGDHLMVFKTTQDGLNAAAWLLHDNYFQTGSSDTPESLGNKWAGDSQAKAAANGVQSYGDSIASIMKMDPQSKLAYGTDGQNVMKALARMENGTAFVIGIPDQMYLTAVAYGSSPEA